VNIIAVNYFLEFIDNFNFLLEIMKKRFFVAVVTFLLLFPLVAYGRLHFLRPPRTDSTQILSPGILYQRDAISDPRLAMIHIVTIDLTKSGIKALVTPQTGALTTSEFLQEFKLQLAINASYFHPFYERSPWDYSPRTGDTTNPIGEVISNGDRYSPSEVNWPTICISRNNIAKIVVKQACPPNTLNAVAGRELLVANGKPVDKIFEAHNDRPYSRVAAAIDQKGEKLWLIIVDGKQPLYSEGLTKVELAAIIAKLGVDKAINLDGGGSTTLVMATNNGTKILNAPMRAKLPMNERPVSNHLGFHALP
jgi:exopolysaccharide biosynthesis protein